MRYQQARAQTDQLAVLHKALNRFQNTYAKNLTDGTAVAGVSVLQSPTVAELKVKGMLDVNFSSQNLYSPRPDGYKAQIQGTGCLISSWPKVREPAPIPSNKLMLRGIHKFRKPLICKNG